MKIKQENQTNVPTEIITKIDTEESKKYVYVRYEKKT